MYISLQCLKRIGTPCVLQSCIQTQYKFTGIASHAAGAPEKGRSALDAVELMNIGVQFREHMSDKARIHYAITDAGGCSPNVVQSRVALYMVRSNAAGGSGAFQKRVDKIAEGAALMTETTYEKKFIDGLADTVSNFALERVLYKNFEELGVPKYTEEENAYADALAETYDSSGVPGVAENDENAKEQVEKMQKEYGHAMNGFLTPLYQKDAFKAGSTDVGDVSWLDTDSPDPCSSIRMDARDTVGRMFPVTAQRLAIKQRSTQEKLLQQPQLI